VSAIWRPRVTKGPRLLRVAADNWTASTIVRLASGAAFSVQSGRDNNNDGNNNDRVNLVPGVNPTLNPDRPRSEVIHEWFNTAAFVENPTGTDGNAPRNFLDGPGYKIVDLGLFRNFGVGGRRQLQVRAEATNAFNLVNLSDPTSNNIRSSTFGQIRSARAMRQIQLGVRLQF
jgi:hypothetical protein